MSGRRLTALAAVVLTAALASGCAVALVSSYDEATDKSVTVLARTLDATLEQLDQDPVPQYAAMAATYHGVRADLNSLRFRNEARPNNSLTVKQLDVLRSQLDTLEGQHKAGRLVREMVGPARDTIQQTLRAILKLELAKKELNKKG